MAFTDTFSGGDAVTLGSRWDAGYTGCTAIQVVSGAAEAITVATQATETVNATGITLGNDQYAQVVIAGGVFANTGVRCDLLILLRAGAGPANTWYEFTAAKNTGSFTSRIQYRTAGTGNLLASESATTWAAGDTLYGEVIGNALVLKRNGVTLLSTTDSNLSSGRAGLAMIAQLGGANTDIVVDTYEAGEFNTALSAIVGEPYCGSSVSTV